MTKYLLLSVLLWGQTTYSAISDELSKFSGHISRVNEKSSLIRVRVDFDNLRYLNKEDEVEFWTESHKAAKCRATIMGKTNTHLLIKVKDYNQCAKMVGITIGAYIRFSSKDLHRNLVMGSELVGILLKKHKALSARKNRLKKDLETHLEKVEAVNERYQLLREKLEKEWRATISSLEDDRSETLKDFKKAELSLSEVDFKLERYKVEEDNFKEHRWSLDHRLYYKK